MFGVSQLVEAMRLQDVKSVLMAMAILLGPIYGSDVTTNSRWFDLISGIALTSRNVIVGTVGRVREIFPPDKFVYPDDYVISELVAYLGSKMKYPHPSLEIPTLDPYFLSQLEVSVTHDMVGRVSVYLEELNITRLSEFNINRIKMNWSQRQLEFDIGFPEIQIRAKYNLEGILGNVIPLHGDGPASISVTNVNVTGTIDLNRHNNSLQVETIIFEYFIEQFHINMTNLMGDRRLSELLNTVLSEEGTRILELVRTDLTNFGANFLHSAGNYVLQKMRLTFSGVLDFMQSSGIKKITKIINLQSFKSEV